MIPRAVSLCEETHSAYRQNLFEPACVQVFALPENINKTAKSALIILAAALLHGCGTGALGPVTLNQTGTALVSLSSSGYTVIQGNVYLFENTDCPQFVGIFD